MFARVGRRMSWPCSKFVQSERRYLGCRGATAPPWRDEGTRCGFVAPNERIIEAWRLAGRCKESIEFILNRSNSWVTSRSIVASMGDVQARSTSNEVVGRHVMSDAVAGRPAGRGNCSSGCGGGRRAALARVGGATNTRAGTAPASSTSASSSSISRAAIRTKTKARAWG